MATETELERLVVRLVGDGSDYQQMIQEAIDGMESLSARSEQLAKAEEDSLKRLSEVMGERNAAVKEGVTATTEMGPALETYIEQTGKLVGVLDRWIANQESSTKALEETQRAAEDVGGASKDLTKETDKVADSTQDASTRINDAGTVMGAFVGQVQPGAVRATRNLGRTASQMGLAFQLINPQIGQTLTTVGLLTSSVGQAAHSIRNADVAFKGFMSLAMNPLTLVAIPLAVTGLVLWKRHSDSVKKAQEELEASTRKVAESAEEYGRYLEIFGKVPGYPPEEGDAQKVESAAKARYKNANLAFQTAQKELAEMQRVEANRRRQWNMDNPPEDLSAGWLAVPIAILTPGRMEAYRAEQMRKAGKDNEKVIGDLTGKMNEALVRFEISKKDWEKTRAPAALEKTGQAWDKFISQQEKRRLLGKEATETEKVLFELMEAGVSGPMLRHAQRTIEQNALDDKRIDQQKALTDEIHRQNKALEEEQVTEYNKQLEDADNLTKQFMTSQEKLIAEKKRLDELLEAKGEEWRPTYDRALKEAHKEAAGLKKEVKDTKIELQGLTSVGWNSAAMWAQLREIGFAEVSGGTTPEETRIAELQRRKGGYGDLQQRVDAMRPAEQFMQNPQLTPERMQELFPMFYRPEAEAISSSGGVTDTRSSRSEALLERIATLAEKHWGGGVALTLESAGLRG